ncbi:MAG: DUF6194 family protein [Chloroflexota bacterium]|nr:DUF6194 family protein [Chloroflexota bacterium]
MNQSEVEAFVESLDNVQREENFGYQFFFVGNDHRLPFVTIANSDNEYDSVSKLDRDGIFRINIGVSRQTFDSLVGHQSSEAVDYAQLDAFLPHPEYAKQNWVCILKPSGGNIEATKNLIIEAHSIAAARLSRKARDSDS